MSFYSNFLSMCNSIGKTPSKVVTEVGLKKSAVTRWKAGGNPTDATAQKIADYFGVSVSELTEKKKNPDPQEGAGTIPPKEYADLNAANKAIVDRLIADLAKSQSENPPSDGSQA